LTGTELDLLRYFCLLARSCFPASGLLFSLLCAAPWLPAAGRLAAASRDHCCWAAGCCLSGSLLLGVSITTPHLTPLKSVASQRCLGQAVAGGDGILVVV